MNKEKVRELCRDWYNAKTKEDENAIIESWLEQNQLEPVIVGLSDSEIDSLTVHLDCFVGGLAKKEDIKFAIEDWRKIQTFAHPNESLIADNLKLAKELEQLKSQQFTPNWGDAPSWANWVAQDRYGAWRWYSKLPTPHKTGWFDNAGDCDTAYEVKNWQQTLQERPSELRNIEVNQSWCWKDADDITDKVVVLFVSKASVVVVDFHNNELFFTRDEFLHNFQKVD